MIIQAVLLVHFLLPAQIAGSQSPPEAARLLQSATDAENRGDLEHAIVDCRKAVELSTGRLRHGRVQTHSQSYVKAGTTKMEDTRAEAMIQRCN